MFSVLPLAWYCRADFAERLGSSSSASQYRKQARAASPEYVFPFQWEMATVLGRAIFADPQDSRAPYLLGNLLFDSQPAEAVKLWETSVRLDPSFPVAHRNLAMAYAHQKPAPDLAKAIAELETAVAAPRKYPLHFAELDELYARTGAPAEKRLALLEKNHAVVAQRDDALSREIGLKIFAGKYDEAIRLMTGRKFSVWEGGSLDVTDHWVDAHLLRGRKRLAAREFQAALQDFRTAQATPENLPTERELGRDAELKYWLGTVNEALGAADQAQAAWGSAAESQSSRRERRGGLSRNLAQNYYRGLALRKLGKNAEAETAFRDLLESAKSVPAQSEKSEETQAARSRGAFAHYVAGLGHLGLGDSAAAQSEFEAALKSAPDLLGAKAELIGP